MPRPPAFANSRTLKTLICVDCQQEFQAGRSDAQRCVTCAYEHRRQQNAANDRRAINKGIGTGHGVKRLHEIECWGCGAKLMAYRSDTFCDECRALTRADTYRRVDAKRKGICERCGQPTSRAGVTRLCIDCRVKEMSTGRDPLVKRRHGLKSKYGMSLAEFNAMFAAQDGECLICGIIMDDSSDKRSPRRVNVDHDHKTNKIRGLLCVRCNQALGTLEPHIARVIAYLTADIDERKKEMSEIGAMMKEEM